MSKQPYIPRTVRAVECQWPGCRGILYRDQQYPEDGLQCRMCGRYADAVQKKLRQ